MGLEIHVVIKLENKLFLEYLMISDEGGEIVSLSIALCTYNGGKYIVEQLQSIAEQTILPDELIICDDCSTDETLTCLHEFAKTAPFAVKIHINEKALGAIHNFEKAISLCQGEYIALSDQDDVWLPEKIEKNLELMQASEKMFANMPILVHTDLCVVNASLKVIKKSMMQMQGIENERRHPFETLLAQNYVTGCTVLINKQLKELALPFPQAIVMHDWWLALLAASNGKIAYLDETTILYRQHGVNTVGAKQYFSINSIKRLLAFTEGTKRIQATISQAEGFANYKTDIFLRGRSITIAYLQSLKQQKYHEIFSLGIRKQGLLRNLFFYIFLVFMKKQKQK